MNIKPLIREIFNMDPDSLEWKLGAIPSGPALIYLYRRFGFTPIASDPYKELCAYALPLKQSALYLSLTAKYCYFQVVLNLEPAQRFDIEMLALKNEWIEKARQWGGDLTPETMKAYEQITPRPNYPSFAEPIWQAAGAALKRLLVPVSIRDVYVNILGPTDPEWDEEKDQIIAYDPSFMAGYGVFTDVYDDPELWYQFMLWLQDAGNGNRLDGIKKVMNDSK